MDKKKKLKINLTSFHQHINFKLKLIKYQIPIKKRKLQKIFHFGYFFIKIDNVHFDSISRYCSILS